MTLTSPPCKVLHYIVHHAGSIEAFPIKAYANRDNHDDKSISQLYMTEVKNVSPFNWHILPGAPRLLFSASCARREGKVFLKKKSFRKSKLLPLEARNVALRKIAVRNLPGVLGKKVDEIPKVR